MTLPRNNDFFMHLFRSKAFVIFTHGLCWLLFFSLPMLFLNQENDNGPIIDFLKLPEYWIFYGIYISLFYFHGHVLFPFLFLQKKYLSYILILILLFTVVFQLKPFHYLLQNAKHTSAKPPNSNLPPGGRPKPFPSNNRRLPPPPREQDIFNKCNQNKGGYFFVF